MRTSDYILRGLIRDLNLRFVLAETPATVAEAVRIHDTDPVASILFGRALTAAILCSPLLTGTEQYMFRWEYRGLLRHMVVDVGADGGVRGIPGARELMHKAQNETEIFGTEDGSVSVVKSDGGQILNSGRVRAGLLDVTADLAFFFCTSDQVETEIATAMTLNASSGRPVAAAAGIMFQALPGCDLEAFEPMRRELHSERVHRLLGEVMPSEKKLWRLIEAVTLRRLPEDGDNIVYDFAGTPEYRCRCCREKLLAAMRTLGEEELRRLLVREEEAKITCEFCHRSYRFRKEDFFPPARE
ncbi:MAG: Hsp33 family molecular chaperone HslO [Victivallales bacterium]|nr:Hsp33 family molecular chaperone HslO [Victivallales bacterium]